MCKEEEFGGPTCNLEVLEKLKKLNVAEDANNANDLWKDLDQFKTKKKKNN